MNESNSSENGGDVLKGKIVGIARYGAFVELENGERGMIHISKISKDYVRRISDYLKVGQEVVVKVIGRTKDGKLDLSMKDLNESAKVKPVEKEGENQKDLKKENFEKKLARFMKESDRKHADYRKTMERKRRR